MPPFRIELRSDTQTVPTADMRAAMAEAEVGDDQAREDPTVRRLEDMAAEMFRKEAALFVSSGTMGNLVSMLTLVGRGDSVVVDPVSHVSLAEAGGFASLAGCSLIPVPTEGVLTADAVRPFLEPVTTHSLKPAIIWADEPTGDLDTETSKEIMDLVIRLNETNLQTFMMVTHSPDVGSMAHRIIRMKDGVIVNDEDTNKLRDQR